MDTAPHRVTVMAFAFNVPYLQPHVILDNHPLQGCIVIFSFFFAKISVTAVMRMLIVIWIIGGPITMFRLHLTIGVTGDP